ncbi:glycogen debranching N-terminal domain-containing protein, partial [Micromonospora sp. NPDC004540]|uniref:glycogen debranching N-terminal domain-containing protein n=1 Tax=Micromonospora sp. NPDC004540 TaxID=3154457 RepID=UPI0033B8F3B8
MSDGLVRLLDGNTFVVSEETGDIDASPAIPTGFFSFDTRFLSKWILSINGQRVNALTVEEVDYFESRFFVVPTVPTPLVDINVSAVRERSIGESFNERLTVINHEPGPVDLRIRIDIESDFADLFEIKDVRSKRGRRYARIEDGCLRLGYRRETFHRETVVSSTEPAHIDEQGLTYDVRLEPHGEWVTDIHVRTLGADGRDLRESLQGSSGRDRGRMRQDLDRWLAGAPRLTCDSPTLAMTYRRSLADLAALRFMPLTGGGHALPAAGLPWFMAIFGRDSVFTSLQALPFAPELAVTTLRLLALLQGVVLDNFREEEPGKMPHELRYGETTGFEEQPHSPYYGSADSTPLYVILLDEYERWTGDAATVRLLERSARAALHWIDEYGDIMGDGYVWYQRRNQENGLENQCWKDS